MPLGRLVDRLEEGVRRGRGLTLVSAPAGFGKTTLAAAWAHATARPVAWLSLDEDDNDPARLLDQMLLALQQVHATVGHSVEPVLRSPQPSPPRSLAALLVNDLAASGATLALVLDDTHLLSSPAAHEVLALLVERRPPGLHLVTVGRHDPPLALPRLRARDELTEVRERDLRLTGEEAASFLVRTIGLPLGPAATAALTARTEGWVAGLQLAALAAREHEGGPEAFAASFSGDERHVADYLLAEVLDRQPADLRDFLTRTSILERLTAPLCDALTGRTDGEATLRRLEDANLFLLPLDRQRAWFRYHRLFSEFLRRSVGPDEQRELHGRAAGWFEARGLAREAVHHALASGDADLAVRLVRSAAEPTALAGGLTTALTWLDALPDDRVRADAALATTKAWALALTGRLSEAEGYAMAAEEHLAEAEPVARGKVLALRALVAAVGRSDHQAASELASAALEALGDGPPHWRAMALWTRAEAQERTGRIADAIATLREARRVGRSADGQVIAPALEMFLAADLNLHGLRGEAVAACEDAIAHFSDAGRVSPLAGLVVSRLGTLLHEANELEAALERLEQGLALAEQLGLDGQLGFCLTAAAPTLQALGRTPQALAALERARALTPAGGVADADWVLATEASLRLQAGDLAFARRWADAARLSPDDPPEYLRMEARLTLARLLIAEGRAADASRFLARLERFAAERGFGRWSITVHVLRALAGLRRRDRAPAREHLARAVRLAAPEGYARAFLDEDPALLGLLPAVREVAPAFVDRLLAAGGALPAEPAGPALEEPPGRRGLEEPLSDRELEVLGLVAAGFSNKSVARELGLALATVKRHLANVHGKLGVSSRTRAAARARELGLLANLHPQDR